MNVKLTDQITKGEGLLGVFGIIASLGISWGTLATELKHARETHIEFKGDVAKMQLAQDKRIDDLTGNVMILHDSVLRLQVALEGLNSRLVIDAKATKDISDNQTHVLQILDQLTKGKP